MTNIITAIQNIDLPLALSELNNFNKENNVFATQSHITNQDGTLIYTFLVFSREKE